MQTLLFPDPRPLVDRMGQEFFRRLPERPGVYLMRDGADAVLYVGKAKNLRRRLGSYRVANPDRMPRRHLRLLRTVARIELEECVDEVAALAREAELLRALRPRFNRVGTWPGTPRFLCWRATDESVELTVTLSPNTEWHRHGPLGAGGTQLCAALARLVWFALSPQQSLLTLPLGWASGRIAPLVAIGRNGLDDVALEKAAAVLDSLLAGEVDPFCQWVSERRSLEGHLFERAMIEADFEFLRQWFGSRSKRGIADVALRGDLGATEE
jgi:hypothetical protein